MKAIFSLALWMVLTNITSQVRLGYTSSEIQKELSKNKYITEEGIDEEGDPYLLIESKYIFTVYFFDNDESYVCLISPKTKDVLTALKEQNNKECIIISDTEWKLKSPNGYVCIELELNDTEMPYFRWYEE